MLNAVDVDLARKTYEWTEEVFSAVRAKERFRLADSRGGASTVDRYLDLLS